MKFLRVFTSVCIGMTLCMAFSSQTFAQEDQLVVVASKPTYDSAIRWVDFLKSKEVPIIHVTGSKFERHKKEKYIVVMGSPNESEGIGKILRTLLTQEEFNWARQQGNRNTYIKSDVWNEDQTIIIFAGYNQDAVNSARKESKDDWWTFISSWFDIDFDLLQLYGY